MVRYWLLFALLTHAVNTSYPQKLCLPSLLTTTGTRHYLRRLLLGSSIAWLWSSVGLVFSSPVGLLQIFKKIFPAMPYLIYLVVQMCFVVSAYKRLYKAAIEINKDDTSLRPISRSRKKSVPRQHTLTPQDTEKRDYILWLFC